MLQWPDASLLTPNARHNLDRLRASGATAELERDEHDWRFEMWSWTDEPTIHTTLRNETNVGRVLVVDGDGVWEARAAAPNTHLSGRGVAGM